MWAIALKEFRELRRDRRTLAMLFLLPFLFLVVFGFPFSRTIFVLFFLIRFIRIFGLAR